MISATIQGVDLEPGDITTMRLALQQFAGRLERKHVLGTGELGETIRQGYRARAARLLILLSE